MMLGQARHTARRGEKAWQSGDSHHVVGRIIHERHSGKPYERSYSKRERAVKLYVLIRVPKYRNTQQLMWSMYGQ